MNGQHQVIQLSLRKLYELCSSGLHTHTQFVKPVSVAFKQSRTVYYKDVAFHIINSIGQIPNKQTLVLYVIKDKLLPSFFLESVKTC